MRRIAVVIGMLVAVGVGTAGCGLVADRVSEVAAGISPEAEALTALGYNPDDVVPSEDPAPAASDGPKADRAKADRPRLERRALRKNTLHGEVVVQTEEGTKTVLVQRGEVTAIDDNGITVKSTDGFSLSWSYGDKLRVIERRATVQADDLAVGDQVGVAGTKDGDAASARLIVIPLDR
jgi:hypothetical protein